MLNDIPTIAMPIPNTGQIYFTTSDANTSYKVITQPITREYDGIQYFIDGVSILPVTTHVGIQHQHKRGYTPPIGDIQ